MNGNSSIFTGSIPPARKFTTMLLEDSDKLLGEEVTISADSTCNSSTKTSEFNLNNNLNIQYFILKINLKKLAKIEPYSLCVVTINFKRKSELIPKIDC